MCPHHQIFDGRANDYSLDNNGFQLVDFTPSDGDLASDQESWRFKSK